MLTSLVPADAAPTRKTLIMLLKLPKHASARALYDMSSFLMFLYNPGKLWIWDRRRLNCHTYTDARRLPKLAWPCAYQHLSTVSTCRSWTNVWTCSRMPQATRKHWIHNVCAWLCVWACAQPTQTKSRQAVAKIAHALRPRLKVCQHLLHTFYVALEVRGGPLDFICVLHLTFAHGKNYWMMVHI